MNVGTVTATAMSQGLTAGPGRCPGWCEGSPWRAPSFRAGDSGLPEPLEPSAGPGPRGGSRTYT